MKSETKKNTTLLFVELLAVTMGPMYTKREPIVLTVYYYQIWTKKEHNIIIGRVISSHMGPMYIETPLLRI